METDRRRWMRALAGAATTELAEAWERCGPAPDAEWIRGPEAGLVMVRGRIGGGGDRFNLGEATVTRATVRVAGFTGSSYVLGSDLDHARYGALFDAVLQDPAQHHQILTGVIEPLEAAQKARDLDVRERSRATVVDFFTVAREHE
ncbi:phosphonate C-P lyase system protein PhnG [Cryptosporangium phraense]|uniref:Phosphonate C-P lyase system protein PhnG n=1 Tax=Cryptosporangium phraense TaxID=2593070 RepID=A0A545AL77_9ACTN|nr:phosphonate C-P lyase system protein PhnG [Cryptosporangium phraense]TQS42066.1 phosphonate C-P lyase system protein PhnG [Cryptosporangium phraense]